MNTNILTILVITLLGINIFFVLCFFIFLINRYKHWARFFKKEDKNFFPTNIRQQCYIIADALNNLSTKKTGALIVFEINNELKKYYTGGIKINALLNSFLISAIFHKSSILHDGAIIISKGKIQSVATYLPMTKNNISSQYGARHRAALGISEKTDCICFIVREKNGKLSYTRNGKVLALPKTKNEIYQFILELIISR